MQNAIQRPESDAYLSYNTSRDKPHGHAVSKILTELVRWADATYPGDISGSERCRARVVKKSVQLDDIHYFETKIAVHGAYQACDRRTLHPDPFSGIASFDLRDDTFWINTIFSSILDAPGPYSTLVATTTMETELLKPDNRMGLEATSMLRWDRKFQSTEELKDHFDKLRELAIGQISMGEAFNALIRQPAISAGYEIGERPCEIRAPLVVPDNAQVLTFPYGATSRDT